MKSITIHGIDPQMESLLKNRASNEGLSMNKTIKKLLSQSLGLESKDQILKKEEFIEFFNIWTEEELNEFEQNTADLDRVNPGDWL